MPRIKEAINQMSVEEKLSIMDYIWASLSADTGKLIPAWHERELKATEARVEAGIERPIPWESAKAILRESFD